MYREIFVLLPKLASPLGQVQLSCSLEYQNKSPHTSVKEMNIFVLIHNLTVFSDFRKCVKNNLCFFFVVVVFLFSYSICCTCRNNWISLYASSVFKGS